VNLQILTGTQTGYSIVMPSATTLSLSAYYQIINLGSQYVSIKDGSGALLFTLAQNSIGYLWLQLNNSTAGTWIYSQTGIGTASGIIHYHVTSSTAFTTSSATDVVITGFTVTPQAGTYALWANQDSSCTQNNSTITQTTYLGGAAVTDSIRRTQSVSANFIFQQTTETVITVNGSQAVDIRVKTNQGSYTVNGRTLLLIRLGN